MRMVPQVGVLQAGDHPQGGGFSAARRPDQHQELPVADVEVHRGDGRQAAGIDFANVFERQIGHDFPFPLPLGEG